MVDEVGATFIDDDFCNGRRYFDAEAPEDGDPVESITERMWNRQVCACKHLPGRNRAACLADRVVDSGRGAPYSGCSNSANRTPSTIRL